ncbi:hypothetical protein FBPa1_0071 [Pseudomonas phage vB_PaeP_FBPa1]|nr:hypothetical protein FBPa1_0071 [Pseudomonas phage vB_PaeP_FBPa1]
MTYGIKLINDNNDICIDEMNPVYVVVQEGTYRYERIGQKFIYIQFPTPIRSQSLPIFFAKQDGPHGFTDFLWFGTNGNWTGCRFVLMNFAGMAPSVYSGKYKIVAIHMPKTAGWGLQVFDGDGNGVFDTGYKPAVFLGAIQRFYPYGWNPNFPGGRSLASWWADATLIKQGAYFRVDFGNTTFRYKGMTIGMLNGPTGWMFIAAFVAGNRPGNTIDHALLAIE